MPCCMMSLERRAGNRRNSASASAASCAILGRGRPTGSCSTSPKRGSELPTAAEGRARSVLENERVKFASPRVRNREPRETYATPQQQVAENSEAVCDRDHTPPHRQRDLFVY